MARFARNAAATKWGLLLAGGTVLGTFVYRGVSHEEATCSPDAEGPRFFAAPKMADDVATEGTDESALPDINGLTAAQVSGRCIQFSPHSYTGTGGKTWFLWKCLCRGNSCCAALDHAQYVGADLADLKAFARSVGGSAMTKADVLCAIDPQGCGVDTPCNKPVRDIPVERRPAESAWHPCHCYAAPYDSACR